LFFPLLRKKIVKLFFLTALTLLALSGLHADELADAISLMSALLLFLVLAFKIVAQFDDRNQDGG